MGERFCSGPFILQPCKPLSFFGSIQCYSIRALCMRRPPIGEAGPLRVTRLVDMHAPPAACNPAQDGHCYEPFVTTWPLLPQAS